MSSHLERNCSQCGQTSLNRLVEDNGKCAQCNGNTYWHKARELLAMHDNGSMTSAREWAKVVRPMVMNWPVDWEGR